MLPARLNRPQYLLHPTRAMRRLLHSVRPPHNTAVEETRLRWGTRLRFCPGEMIGASIATGRVFDPCVSETLYRLLDLGETAVDAGANIGYMASIMTARVGPGGTVICFEPHPDVYRELVANAALWKQDGGVGRVVLHEAALAATSGTGALLVSEAFGVNRGSASLRMSPRWDSRRVETVEVALRRLDELVDEPVGLLKVDVEGAELDVLAGARGLLENDLVRDIVFESKDPYPSETTDLLEKLGFVVFSLDNTLLRPTVAPAAERPPRRGWEGPSYLASTAPERAVARLRAIGWAVLGIGPFRVPPSRARGAGRTAEPTESGRREGMIGRGVVTTVPADLAALRLDGVPKRDLVVKSLDRRTHSRIGLLARLVAAGGRYDAVLLNGSGRLDQIAAALISLRRGRARVVISDSTWQTGTWRLDRLLCRIGIRLIDTPRVTYCVLSTAELDLFPRTWNVDRDRVVFTPFCYTLTEEELDAPVSDDGGVFAGGESMRDYGPLLEVAPSLPVEVLLAAGKIRAPGTGLPDNVRAGRLPHRRFVEALRRARVVVVPVRPGAERSAGQQTYLNAMALGKLVVATDSPGARDYIEDGRTGLIVPPGDTSALATALRWALDPANAPAVARIRSRAREVVRRRFSPEEHFASLLGVVEEALGRAESTAGGSPVAAR